MWRWQRHDFGRCIWPRFTPIKPEQQIVRGHAAIFGCAAQIILGCDGTRQSLTGRTGLLFGEGGALQQSFGFRSACRHWPAATMGDARAGDDIAITLQQHGKPDRADILIMPAREFLGRKNCPRRGPWDENPRNYFMLPQRIAPIAEQEILNRQIARALRPGECHPRAKRQSGRQRIANRARGAQIPTKRAERADLA